MTAIAETDTSAKEIDHYYDANEEEAEEDSAEHCHTENGESEEDGDTESVTTPEAAFLWADWVVQRLQTAPLVSDVSVDFWDRFLEKFSALRVTTGFSGMGGAEESIRHLRKAVRAQRQHQGEPRMDIDIQVLHSSDICASARAVLLSREGCCRSHCLFSDILDRMPASFRNELRRLQQQRDERVQVLLSGTEMEPVDVYSSVGSEFLTKVSGLVMEA